MAYHGKIQIMMLIVAPPDQVAEGDRLFASHGAFMEATHYRSGEKALLSYNVSKAPELSDPVDMNSAPTGNTCFVLNEVYENRRVSSTTWSRALRIGKTSTLCSNG